MDRSSDVRRRLRPAPAVQARLFDEELVILDMARGDYLSLDAIGARLWGGLEAGRSIDEVAQEVVAEYDVSLDQAKADLQELTNDLLARRLLVEEGADG